jgi:hypothetical protein
MLCVEFKFGGVLFAFLFSRTRRPAAERARAMKKKKMPRTRARGVLFSKEEEQGRPSSQNNKGWWLAFCVVS